MSFLQFSRRKKKTRLSLSHGWVTKTWAVQRTMVVEWNLEFHRFIKRCQCSAALKTQRKLEVSDSHKFCSILIEDTTVLTNAFINLFQSPGIFNFWKYTLQLRKWNGKRCISPKGTRNYSFNTVNARIIYFSF